MVARATTTSPGQPGDVSGHRDAPRRRLDRPGRAETDPCASPVGLCTIAQMLGALRGEVIFTAAGIIQSVDTPNTGVVFVTGDTVVVDAGLAGRRGTIDIKNAAAFRTTGDNALADAQTIVGGTGDFAGATGSLRISGDFVPGIGRSSTYEGFVCFP